MGAKEGYSRNERAGMMRFDDDDDGRKTNTNTNESGCSSSCAELLVYDFDGTLANTPTPREGKIMYETKSDKRGRTLGGGGDKRAWSRL